jgi:hypothetical protein
MTRSRRPLVTGAALLISLFGSLGGFAWSATPALAVNNLITQQDCANGVCDVPYPCIHGSHINENGDEPWVGIKANNCDVRVWFYPQLNQQGTPICINPHQGVTLFSRTYESIYISNNGANC